MAIYVCITVNIEIDREREDNYKLKMMLHAAVLIHPENLYSKRVPLSVNSADVKRKNSAFNMAFFLFLFLDKCGCLRTAFDLQSKQIHQVPLFFVGLFSFHDFHHIENASI